ncbi:hypothetical protein PR202_gb13222 [Eleusine coracana subsp. coracana]|uniref:ABC1 atypical kinase-like domain-containing protein n=1 Tax=Eleusine coracana subsp. coracana TaxID=191504 RepID=A0AAV5ERW2_ELECO|nr:hypothetical protein PR202_gb13222 [Eleusine coracana subsp. coracana]
MLRHRHAPLLLAAAAAGATLLAESPSGDSGRSIASTLHHGLARSSRAVYTIGFVVADYKYSLRGLSTGSADYREKLSEATPSSFQDIKLVLQKNFGRNINDIFLELDEHPIAAASIAQVQYPGLEQHMKIDIMTMSFLSKSVSWSPLDPRGFPLLLNPTTAATVLASSSMGAIAQEVTAKAKQIADAAEAKAQEDAATKEFAAKKHALALETARARACAATAFFEQPLPPYDDVVGDLRLEEIRRPVPTTPPASALVATPPRQPNSTPPRPPALPPQRSSPCTAMAAAVDVAVVAVVETTPPPAPHRSSPPSTTHDFMKEAKNSERTASCFRKNSVVKVPYVFWVDDLDFLRRENINPTKVAKALVELFGEMIFVHGFVHGDPHPGNILVSPQGHGNFSLVLGHNFSGLLRSILGNLEVPRHVRLLTYAKCAVDGLDKQSKMESGK